MGREGQKKRDEYFLFLYLNKAPVLRAFILITLTALHEFVKESACRPAPFLPVLMQFGKSSIMQNTVYAPQKTTELPFFFKKIKFLALMCAYLIKFLCRRRLEGAGTLGDAISSSMTSLLWKNLEVMPCHSRNHWKLCVKIIQFLAIPKEIWCHF